MARTLHGRTVIYSNQAEITRNNVVDVLNNALAIHNKNAEEINYLYNYYKGVQPILGKEKTVRPEINNKVVENRANEIVTFKVGYLVGEPIQYVNRSKDDINEDLNRFNDFMSNQDKDFEDVELATDFTICGTAYRMITPKKMLSDDDVPFLFYTLDPQTSFVVYYSGLGHRALMGVIYVVNEDNRIVYSVYTRNTYFEIIDNAITKEVEHILGGIPIIEYPADKARLGAFEVVLPLLDAINEVDSGRLDGVQQFIESLLVLKGVDITDDDFQKLKELGGLKLPIDGDASYLSQELNQSQIQELADNLYQVVLTICGMPNRNGGSSTSDTGAAVIMRDGWSDAESRAKNTEKYFKRSEKLFLRLAINIANTIAGMDMKLYTINIRFTRRNYENIEGKANVLVSMLSNNKIHPKLAFEHCGMFVDPELAYTISKEYAEEYESKLAKSLSEYNQSEIDKEKQIIDDSDEG